MPKYIDADEYIKYCEENWIALNVDAVNKQPEADVEPVVHGRWIEYEHEGQMAQYCSECGSDPGVIYIYRRCPECGAYMNAKRVREDNDD